MTNLNVTGNITCQGGGVVVPIGTILDFAGVISPQHYLLCNGQAVSRTTYAELFAIIGTSWGAGDGSTTFNVPNLQGRTTIGAGTNDGTSYNVANRAGSKDAIVVSHSHTFTGNIISGEAGGTDIESLSWRGSRVQSGCLSYSDNNSTKYAGRSSGASGYTARTIKFNATPSGTISNTGESGTNKNMMPYGVVNKIIRAK